MNFTVETARTQQLNAVEFAEEIFADRLSEVTDAVYLNADKKTILAVTGLPYYMPVANALVNDRLLCRLMDSRKNILISTKDEDVIYKGNARYRLNDVQKQHIKSICDNIRAGSGKLNDEGDLIIDLKAPHIGTHYSVNLLLGDREGFRDPLQTTPKSVLDRFGRGSFRSPQEKQVLATRYELNPDINGETANRQFYITENGKQIFYSLDVNSNVKSAFCVHHNNYTEIIYETECGLKITRTIFILPQERNFPSAEEVQRIRIENLTGKDRELRVVVTGMFGITDPGTLTSDIIYANVVVESEVYSMNDKPVALTAHHQPKECNGEKRFAMVLAGGETMDEYTSDVNGFIGSGSYDRPERLNRLSNSHLRRGASFFAMAKNITVKAESSACVDEFVGMSEDPKDVRRDFDTHLYNLYTKYSDEKELDKTLDKVRNDFRRYRSFLSVNTGDRDLDAYLSNNLPFQVLYQTYISRSFAWTQKSYRETGFREIQDIFASMYYLHGADKDKLSRQLLASWIANVFDFGYAYHNFTTRGKEPGMCSDDQLWLVQAVYRYIKLTGDRDFLLEEFPVAGSDRKRRLIDTLQAIIVYSGRISVGKHGLPLLDTADWNDTLRLDKSVYFGPEKEEMYYNQLKDGEQKYGDPLENTLSESVMNAFLLVIAADETRELAEMVDEADIRKLACEIHEDTVSNIRKHCWKKNYFARCLMNDERKYKYIGSSGDGLSLDDGIDGTYYLNSFSWSLLADVATDEETESMLNVIDKYLKTPAGLKLCTPIDYDLLGVKTGTALYFPGDRENGGVFKHAAMMAVVGCLRAAKKTRDEKLAERLSDLAFFMINKTLPYRTLENPYVLKGNPRFCTQYNNSETGENIGPILSGTSSWLTLALYEICGININGDTIHIAPIVDRNKLNYTLDIRGTRISVRIDATRKHRSDENSEYYLDGYISSPFILLPQDKKDHEIRILL